MAFRHKANAEDAALLEKGEYDAEVKRATARVSKGKTTSGAAMLELILTVYGAEGRKEDVFDYLIDSDTTAWKIKNFCASAGLDYEAGEIDEATLPRTSVKILLGVEPAQNGYPAKNKVVDYLPREGGSKPAPPAGGEQAEFQATDDDVPF